MEPVLVILPAKRRVHYKGHIRITIYITVIIDRRSSALTTTDNCCEHREEE